MSLHVTPQERRLRTKTLQGHKTKLPKHVPRGKRERLEQAIEARLAEVDALIGVLDLYDGDAADYEDDRSDYESTTGGSIDQGSITAKGYWMDDLEEDQSDKEPSLAHTLDVNQERALKHLPCVYFEDAEQEHDGREDDEREQVNEDRDDADLEALCPPNLSPVF